MFQFILIGGFLLAMGIIGFLIWRNPESLFLGIAPGAAIFGLGITSLKVWRGGKSSVPFILAQAGYFFLNFNTWCLLLYLIAVTPIISYVCCKPTFCL